MVEIHKLAILQFFSFVNAAFHYEEHFRWVSKVTIKQSFVFSQELALNNYNELTDVRWFIQGAVRARQLAKAGRH